METDDCGDIKYHCRSHRAIGRPRDCSRTRVAGIAGGPICGRWNSCCAGCSYNYNRDNSHSRRYLRPTKKNVGVGARRSYLLALRPLGYSGDTSNYIRQHRKARVQVKLGAQPISNVKLSFSTCYVITSTAKQFEISRVLSKLTNYVKEGDNVL